MIKRGLTLDNALNITPLISTNDAAGPEAAGPRTGGTTALVRTPVRDEGQGLAVGKLGRRAPEAAWAATRSGGRGDQRPARPWHLGANLFRPGRMAVPGVQTDGGGSGCWSRFLASKGAQSHPGSHGVWHTMPQPLSHRKDLDEFAKSYVSGAGLSPSAPRLVQISD